MAKGYKILAKGGDFPFLITDGLAFRAEVVTKRTQEVQGVVRALVEARAFLQAYPHKGFPILAKGMGVSRNEAEVKYQKLSHPLSLAENLTAFKPAGGTLFVIGQQIIEFFFQKGTLITLPDIHTIVDGQFVVAIEKKP